MTIIQTIRLLHLLAYFIISSQLAYYLFVMSDVFSRVPLSHFIAIRKLTDPLVHQRHIPIYYACAILGLLLLLVMYQKYKTTSYIFLSLSFACLIADIIIAQAGNAPINKAFNSYPNGPAGDNWEQLRFNWLHYIRLRAGISIAGFLSLLAGLLWFR